MFYIDQVPPIAGSMICAVHSLNITHKFTHSFRKYLLLVTGLDSGPRFLKAIRGQEGRFLSIIPEPVLEQMSVWGLNDMVCNKETDMEGLKDKRYF